MKIRILLFLAYLINFSCQTQSSKIESMLGSNLDGLCFEDLQKVNSETYKGTIFRYYFKSDQINVKEIKFDIEYDKESNAGKVIREFNHPYSYNPEKGNYSGNINGENFEILLESHKGKYEYDPEKRDIVLNDKGEIPYLNFRGELIPLNYQQADLGWFGFINFIIFIISCLLLHFSYKNNFFTGKVNGSRIIWDYLNGYKKINKRK